MKAVVIGGGLAGCAAALKLADGGHDVTLLEARPTLGGAVQTLPEREEDPSPAPDNGQHIALGVFWHYLAFLDRIGQSAAIRRIPLALPVIDLDGRVAIIKPSATSLLRYRHVTFRDRVRILRLIARLPRCLPHRGEGFGAYLTRNGQSEAAIDRFWDVFMRPALNLKSHDADAGLGWFVARTAFERGARENSDLILPIRPLGEMHGVAAGRALELVGATVRTSARAIELEEHTVHLANGERLDADCFVVAVPPEESASLLGEPVPDFGYSPIVSVHLLFDRQILEYELVALLDSPAHWVFDRGRLTGHKPRSGQYLTVVSSAVPELLDIRGRELVDLVASALTDRLGNAELLWSRVSREPRATIAARPGVGRPRATTVSTTAARAGAWTGGWPVTMEGAVQSGEEAVSALLSIVEPRVVA